MLNRHLWSTLYVARAFVPHLVANGWGRLIGVSSPAASDPPPKQLPYAVGKAAQEALFLTLAQELKGSGVTANLLIVRKIEAAADDDREPGKPTGTATGTPPKEIAAAMLYLCSDAARAVNGARLPLYRG
jgi:NAD(P)-dependent dehydrogenase (short-subunit alcohol dehydrogenase family)